ncbi:Aste57867_8679 [Aphanomyces stellatus]|uniref:Aste57867_8679 protein n=1 Tax=Aphanomyces stellatus TaxID=120398 RepID=A0A485KKZ6_9STRA|nr:hypothetical protein As57867_008645 [Aphanomyces stellatus]VFT85565.1 Aste57867_8679 [Aphanomyces stellatus]
MDELFESSDDGELSFMEKHGTSIAFAMLFFGFIHFSYVLYTAVKPFLDDIKKVEEAEKAELEAMKKAGIEPKPLLTAKARTKSKKDQ